MPPPDFLPIAVHPRARFSCEGVGTCCTSGYAVRLEPEEAAAVEAAAHRLFPGAPAPVRLLPAGRGLPPTLALATAPRCPFLDAEARCLVHGTPAQPSPCRVFPYRFVVGPERVHASVSHRCLCGALDRGELLSAQRTELRARLEAVPLVHAVPETTAIDARRAAPTEDVVPAILRAADAPDAFAILLTLVEEFRALAHAPRASGPPEAPDSEPADVLPDLRDRLGASTEPLARALDGAEHPRRAELFETMLARGLFVPDADPHAEVARFVRDFVFGLQLYRFETLAAGVLGLGLAVDAILTDLPEAARHPTARTRIMLWESALTASTLPALLGHDPTLESVEAELSRRKRSRDR